jgi:hypothetical protein
LAGDGSAAGTARVAAVAGKAANGVAALAGDAANGETELSANNAGLADNGWIGWRPTSAPDPAGTVDPAITADPAAAVELPGTPAEPTDPTATAAAGGGPIFAELYAAIGAVMLVTGPCVPPPVSPPTKA